MQATPDELAYLLQLQNADIELLRAQKKFDGLGQRKAILACREKTKAVEAKRDQLAELRRQAEVTSARICDEDARLDEKQRSIQEKIDSARGDYRGVESLSKELGGIAKRRVTLEEDLARASGEIARISSVENQVGAALEALQSQERDLTESFQAEGGALSAEIAARTEERTALIDKLPAALGGEYTRCTKRCGGIAVARMASAKCSVCRNVISEGKLLFVQSEAPLSTCPYCHRLLVIQ